MHYFFYSILNKLEKGLIENFVMEFKVLSITSIIKTVGIKNK